MKAFNSILKSMMQVLGLIALLGAASVAQAETQNSITALNVSGASDGATVVKVDFAHPLTALPRDFTINTPPRIALDFPNTANALGKSMQNFAEGELRSANIVQAGNRTRLVINLNQMLTYDTRIVGNSLLITLQGKAPATAVAGGNVSRFAEVKQSAQKHSLRDVDFRRGKSGEGRIQVDLSDSGMGIDIRQQGTTLIVDFLKAGLPRNLQRKLDVADFATPVQGIDTFVQGENVRMVIEPKGLWEHAAYQTDNKFIVEVKPIADDPNKLVKGSQIGYAGEKLTLNFQKIDVRDALYIIADFNNENNNPMNLVISDTVGGNLTLRLKDVPWDQALDIILQSRGLDMRKNGNVIQVAPRDEIAAKEKIDLTARQEISELEELRTESFRLSYQTPADMITMLTNKDQRILSKRGSVVADPRTGTIFVQDTSLRLEEVRKILRQIDVPVRQVLIEARFVSAKNAFTQSLGGKLSYTGPAVGPGAGDAIGPVRALGQPNVNLPGATSGTGGLTLSLFNPMATKVLTLELTASELDGTSKNIASPRVVTKDKVAATISQGTKIPSLCYSQGGGSIPCWLDAVLSLEVVPQITPDDNINMKVNAKHDIPVGTNIDTKSVVTEVMVENGGTVVIGGVFTQDIGDDTQKVPLLGDVPVVGWLFKNNVKSDTKSELLIFITPKIMSDATSLR